MDASITRLQAQDPELWAAIAAEGLRQTEHVELIASENYASAAVMAAQGSLLTNKYAEGYPGRRYYGGCDHVDDVERLAIARAKQLFDAPYANVQPHSGSQANAAVYLALVPPGGKILGMGLDHGGHLTHGSKVNFSGMLYQSITYGVRDSDGSIDYDQLEALAKAEQPDLIVAGFSAYSRTVDWARFRAVADAVGVPLMVDMAHVAGLVAAGVYPSPVPFADVCTSTTHKTLRGPRGGLILARDDEALWKKLNSAVFPGLQGGPLMHVIAAKAVAFGEALAPAFKVYQKQVVCHAQAMAKRLMGHGFDVVSGGTDNHLLLLSLVRQGITGKAAEKRLGEAAITVNKNTVPNDPQSPFVTSGLRLGTPAVTSRGYGVEEVELVSDWIAAILLHMDDDALLARVRSDVLALNQRFPVLSAAQGGM